MSLQAVAVSLVGVLSMGLSMSEVSSAQTEDTLSVFFSVAPSVIGQRKTIQHITFTYYDRETNEQRTGSASSTICVETIADVIPVFDVQVILEPAAEPNIWAGYSVMPFSPIPGLILISEISYDAEQHVVQADLILRKETVEVARSNIRYEYNLLTNPVHELIPSLDIGGALGTGGSQGCDGYKIDLHINAPAG